VITPRRAAGLAAHKKRDAEMKCEREAKKYTNQA
jgi:hypothetical protein